MVWMVRIKEVVIMYIVVWVVVLFFCCLILIFFYLIMIWLVFIVGYRKMLMEDCGW